MIQMCLIFVVRIIIFPTIDHCMSSSPIKLYVVALYISLLMRGLYRKLTQNSYENGIISIRFVEFASLILKGKSISI